MKVTRWGVCAGLALCFAGASAMAGDTDELNSMKATMENMKQEMEAMRSTLATEREALRANAGGAPESLKSASGKATVKIGGNFMVRYNISSENGYGNSTQNDPNDNSRYTRTSWDIYKAEINFKIDFTPDTCGYIALRPDRGSASVGQLLDQVWWKWSNIGGTGFAAKVGLQKLDIGMYNGSDNPWDRVMVLDPMVKTQAKSYNSEAGQFDANNTYNGAAHDSDITAIGVSAEYKWDQFKVSAGIYGQQVSSDDGMDNTLGVTTDGTARNLDIENHFVTGHYDPCWLEGLHMQATYFGEFDNGEGVPATWYPSNWSKTSTTNYLAARRGATYVPAFDLGVFYKADKWAVYGEFLVVVNPRYYQDSVETVLSLGADYSLTEKLKIGGSFDWKNIYGSHFYGDSRVSSSGVATPSGDTLDSYTLRAAIAAKYDFGNGLYVQAQYSHYLTQAWGVSDNKTKDCDAVTLQTGFKF